MKDVIVTIGCMIVASVGATYVIREIENDFWRTKHHYGNIKRGLKNKFKTAKV